MFGFVSLLAFLNLSGYLMPNSIILINTRSVDTRLVCTRVKKKTDICFTLEQKGIGLVCIRVKKVMKVWSAQE